MYYCPTYMKTYMYLAIYKYTYTHTHIYIYIRIYIYIYIYIFVIDIYIYIYIAINFVHISWENYLWFSYIGRNFQKAYVYFYFVAFIDEF